MRAESIHTASLIRKKRRELDITQQELSRLIGWGEDKNGQFLSNLERGRAQLPPKHINITSKILGIDKMLLIEQMANDYKQSLIKMTGNDLQSDLPCVVCGENRDGYVTVQHIYTQKSFPEYKDKKWNLISLCQKHHNEAHSLGNQSFAKKYVNVSKWLEENGWIVFNGKLINRNMYE